MIAGRRRVVARIFGNLTTIANAGIVAFVSRDGRARGRHEADSADRSERHQAEHAQKRSFHFYFCAAHASYSHREDGSNERSGVRAIADYCLKIGNPSKVATAFISKTIVPSVLG